MATTAATSPGTLANDASFGDVAWSDASNAASSNDTYATSAIAISQTSQYLKATNFGFSIPGGSRIDGITVEIEKSVTALSNVTDVRVRIVKGGAIGSTDKSDVDNWSTTDTYETYGGAADLWGETWTATDINVSTFGVVIAAQYGSGVPTAQVDHIRITVTYIPGLINSIMLLGVGK